MVDTLAGVSRLLAIILIARHSLYASDQATAGAVDFDIERLHVASGVSDSAASGPPRYTATASYHRFTRDGRPLTTLNAVIERAVRERIARFRDELTSLASENASVAASDFVHELTIETAVLFLNDCYISLEMTIGERRLLGTFYPDLERRFFSYDLSAGSLLNAADLFAASGYEAYMVEILRTALHADIERNHTGSVERYVERALREDRFSFDDTHLYIVVERSEGSKRAYEWYPFTWLELDPWLAAPWGPARRVYSNSTYCER